MKNPKVKTSIKAIRRLMEAQERARAAFKKATQDGKGPQSDEMTMLTELIHTLLPKTTKFLLVLGEEKGGRKMHIEIGANMKSAMVGHTTQILQQELARQVDGNDTANNGERPILPKIDPTTQWSAKG